MLEVLLDKMSKIQDDTNHIMADCIKSMTKLSEGGKVITENESSVIINNLSELSGSIINLVTLLKYSDAISFYNSIVVSDIEDCNICKEVDAKVKNNDIAKNPLFASSLFNIKNLLEDIDDKIAEKSFDGIRKCLSGIASELNNFFELKEVANAIDVICDTFTDVNVVIGLVYDFEKFFHSVFLLHEEINIGIAMGSLTSAMEFRKEDDLSGIEFF